MGQSINAELSLGQSEVTMRDGGDVPALLREIERLKEQIKCLSAENTAKIEKDDSAQRTDGDVSAISNLSSRHELDTASMVKRYLALYESGPDAFLEIDAKGVVTGKNRIALDLFKMSTRKMIGRPYWDLFHPSSRGLLRDVVVQPTGGATEMLAYLEDGRAVGLVCSQVDFDQNFSFHISIRETTGTIAVQRAKAQQAHSDSLADFAAALAREYNDPISVITGRIEIILDVLNAGLPPTVIRHLEIALNRSLRLVGSLRNLRVVGSARLERLDLIFPREIISDAYAGMVSMGHSLVFDAQFSDDLESGGERARFVQMMTNILEYLFSRTKEMGGVHVSATTGDSVQIIFRSASDQHALSRIAEEVDHDVSLVGGNRVGERLDDGLGLWVASLIAESVGGSLVMHHGAQEICVILGLPASPGRPPTRPRSYQGKILVVGPIVFHSSLPVELEKNGWEVDEVMDSNEALEVLRNSPEIDAVLSDFLIDNESKTGLSFLQSVTDISPHLSHARAIAMRPGEIKMLPIGRVIKVLNKPLHRAELLSWLTTCKRSTD